MKIKDQPLWDRAQANNQDGYGQAIHGVAVRWADAMEAELASGATVADCAWRAFKVADTEGITGFMYGAAVATLAAVWEHGEDLRVWHNLRTQIGTEGERANANGTTLNPALLTVGE